MDYIAEAKRVIDSLFSEAPTKEEFVRNIISFNSEHPDQSFSLTQGASRVVAVSKSYVVKCNLYGEDEYGNCVQEYENYLTAQKAGYSYLFAKPTLYKTLLIMPRIEGVEKAKRNLFFAGILTDEELHFLSGIVCDLHGQNYGFKNGYPVIIDYAFKAEES